MNPQKALIILLVLSFIGVGGWYLYRRAQPSSLGVNKGDLIRVSAPIQNQVVGSPLSIEGEARGNWYFEASFPIRLVDANGNVLGTAVAQAQSDWMTGDFVRFKAQLTFGIPATEQGVLILKKDNPSGLPGDDDELRIPVLFDLSVTPQRLMP